MISGYRFVCDAMMADIEILVNDTDTPNTVKYPMLCMIAAMSLVFAPMVYTVYYMQFALPAQWRIPAYQEWVEAQRSEGDTDR